MSEGQELYKRHRPTRLDALIGQPAAVKVIQGWIEKESIPHAILLSGPSGCGKTTVARIIKKQVGCTERRDFIEINAASSRGVDTIREIESVKNIYPIGKSRVYFLDEAHMLTKEAQNSLLKLLEDTPPHIYFFLCTTDPQKLIKTIITRCSEVKLRSLSAAEICTLLDRVSEEEKFKLTEDVRDRITDAAGGSARQALVLLHMIFGLKTEAEQLQAIERTDSTQDSITIVRTLMDQRTNWATMRDVLSKCDLGDPEGIRRLVLGYTNKVVMSERDTAKLHRSFVILDYFQDSFYDSGLAGLLVACRKVIASK